MVLPILKQIFERDLGKLKAEIASYKSEEAIWNIYEGIANSGGNLCLHLIGNLNTYIGRNLGNTDYIRNRAGEFSFKNVPREVIIDDLEKLMKMIDTTLSSLSEKDMEKEFPELVFAERTSIGFMLIHLATHLTYHLGQINYHRRMLDR